MTEFMLRKLVALGSAALLSTLLGTGCAAEPTDDDAGDEVIQTDDELSAYSDCTLTRSQILSSVSGGRRRAIERGFRWLDADVPYSQSRSYEGYRTDCSGFVSMCWELDQSYPTSTFYAGDGDSNVLGSFDELIAGDALVKNGHMVLFLGWKDRARSAACVLEQQSTDNDMRFQARSVDSLRSQRYRALRADKFY